MQNYEKLIGKVYHGTVLSRAILEDNHCPSDFKLPQIGGTHCKSDRACEICWSINTPDEEEDDV